MSDLIKRKSIRNMYSCLDPEDKVRVAQVLTDIDAIPSTDAVEVVRCKDCRYKDMELCAMYKLVVAGVRRYDDFCSLGEKETDHE